jgi:general secretion pathway protein B
MSYILDALKKIEHEKNKKTLPDGRVSISGDLFQERKQPPAKARIWKTMALIVVASLVTCAGTWFVLQGNGKKSRKSAAAVRQAASTPAPAPVIPQVAPAPATAPVQSQPVPAAAPPAAPTAAVPAAEAGEDDETSRREARRAQRGIKAQSPAALPKQPPQNVQSPADIKLSGIAWQEERTARRAVVNGFLLKEGAVVSGAKIIDIRADRVRFSSAAGQFEIKLDAVLPAGTPR